MSAHPRIVKAGIVVTDFVTSAVIAVIAFQFNPDSLARTITAKTAAENAGPVSATRYTGVAAQTIRFEAFIDATDQLELGNATAEDAGIYPQLATLEGLLQPSSASILANIDAAQRGILEILPTIAPLPLFVWGKHRILPVSITELSITEQIFDTQLNPIRATVAISATVLTVENLGAKSRGGGLALAHLMDTERLAARDTRVAQTTLGVSGL